MAEQYEHIASEDTLLLTEEDVLDAMRDMPGYIDITTGDFKIIFEKAYQYARKKILKDTKAGSIMHQPAVCIFEEQSLAELIMLLNENGISGVPVLDAFGKVSGVASEKDILRSLGQNSETKLMGLMAASLQVPFTLTEEERCRKVKQIMSLPPVIVEVDAPLGDIITIFDSRSLNRLPVVDAKGAPLGVITRHNIIRAFGRLL